MTHIRRQAFDRDKIARNRGRCRNLTGTQRFPVLKYCTGAANSHAAAKFGASQTKIVPKQPKKRSIVIRFDRAPDAVNREVKLAHAGLIIATLLKTETLPCRSKSK